MSVADLSPETLTELASYLNDFLPVPEDSDEEDSEQYWYCLAVTLRNLKLGEEFNYTAFDLVKIGAEPNSARSFLKLLVKNKLKLSTFLSCLKKIKCQKAINVFTRASPPIIRDQPRMNEVTVSYGGTITMSVEAECEPGPPDYQWFKDQRNPLPNQNTRTLLLTKANTSDEGYYHCRVTNPLINDPQKASVFSKYVYVVVPPPELINNNPTIRQATDNCAPTPSLIPRITLHPSPLTAPPGIREKLECWAERAVCYDWYRNGKPVSTEKQNGVLWFESLSDKDNGKYYCEAVNDHGRAESRVVQVAVEAVVPSIEAQESSGLIVFEEQPPESLEVNVGDDIVLKCRASSRSGEPVSYEWWQISPSGHKKRQENNNSVYIAKTTNISRRLKLTMYCEVSLAKNPRVIAKSRETKVLINTVWITKQPQSLHTALIGNKGFLNCSAEGLEEISYTWFKSSTRDGNFQPIKKKPDKSGVLHFNRLGQKDWGYYHCQAENSTMFVTSETVSVRPTIPSIRRSNSFKLPLIRIKKNPWPQLIPEGQRFRLLCEAVCSEDVPLDYQWYHCGKKIHGATESVYIKESTKDSDCGPYYCEVRCALNPMVKPEVSKTARIELASRTSGQVIVGQNIAQRQQLKGEELYTTKNEERYAREKVALLIGNQNYQCDDLNDLHSPEYDIRQLRMMLEDELNFKVISLLDLTHAEMMRALEFFYEMLAIPGVYALFYYSGHGFITEAQKNFLIPVNATLPLTCDLNINADSITKQMRKKLSRAVVVLDCCRVQTRIGESLSSLSLDSMSESEVEDDPINMANYVQITSCQDGNPAYDGSKTELSPGATPTVQAKPFPSPVEQIFPCSNFNIAFREALKEKKEFYDVFHYVLDKLSDIETNQNTGRQGMRPTYTVSLKDRKITLHDDVFMDNSDDEPKLEKILKLHEEVHYVPDTIIMDSQDEIGQMSGQAQLELSFTYDFTNVLCVHTRLHLLHRDKTTKASIKYDINFLERQGVFGRQTDCKFESPLEDGDVGGQGESLQLVSTMIRISSIQRLRSEMLKLFMTLSLYSGGKQIISQVMYEFPKKPLFASLS